MSSQFGSALYYINDRVICKLSRHTGASTATGVAHLFLMLAFAALLLPAGIEVANAEDLTLLNVSYDPTREFYQTYNAMFRKYWKEKTGDTVKIEQSHGGSSKQARSVIDGLEADVVTLALAYDVDAIVQQSGLISKDWITRLPSSSCPYTSTIVFLVRKGNPKNIKDWSDLLQDGLEIVTPNPKTSGGARYNFLAAWGYALRKNNNDEAKAKEFVSKIYSKVPVLDSGARGSTTTFVQRGIGDVLLAWENEAFLAMEELGKEKLDIVFPSMSMLAEPTVALVDQVVDKKRSRKAAEAYLEYLYSEPAQDLIAKNHFRPVLESAIQKSADKFTKIELFKLSDICADWNAAQKKFFDDGAIFDEIFVAK